MNKFMNLNRDDYINIAWQNIGIGRDYAFYALPFEQWENLNLPYDHRSVSRIFIFDFKTLK